MDTKLRKSKADRKVSIDLIVIIVAAILWSLILINEYSYAGLSLSYSTSSFIQALLAFTILCLLVSRLFLYFKAPLSRRSFWHGSVLMDYFHIWRTGIRASLQNWRLLFGLIIMLLLTAIAGICVWEAATNYGICMAVCVVPGSVYPFQAWTLHRHHEREQRNCRREYSEYDSGYRQGCSIQACWLY
ncbi:hypothetical protein SAMN06272722_11559 [Paenibacillus sp. RU5A]|nr:hypothetical protein SAMN06272722_11559 [Paenibacillus sp. RU5A]SOC76045.1 hypothetical protein SAMN05880581_11559 [Paenibacillus sp. RU26A]SOC77770.1 hypothetical protein SAMN05880586_11559 [Paenibacillus sp. RU5M]